MKKLKACLILMICMMLSGCWDSIEIANTGFVISIGIDKFEPSEDELQDENEDKRFTLTVEIPSDEAMVEGSSGSGGKIIKIASANTIEKAMEKINAHLAKSAYYGHTKLVIIGGEILEDSELFKEAVESLEQNREISQKTIVLASKSTAKEILGSKSEEESLTGFYMSDFYKKNSEALVYRQSISSLITDMDEEGDFIIPQIEIKDEGIVKAGAAIMGDKSLKKWMDKEDMETYLLIMGKAKEGVVSVKYKDQYIPITITEMKSKMEFYEYGDRLICHLKIDIRGKTSDYKYSTKKEERTDYIDAIENTAEASTEAKVYNLMEIGIKEIKADIFQIKEKLRKYNYEIYIKHLDDWETILQNIQFEIEADYNIIVEGAIK